MIRMPKTQRNTNLSTVAVAALVGGLAGAVVGLMFAPKSGKALRQGIQEKADNVLEHVEDVTLHHAGALKQQSSDLVDKGKQLAEDLHTFIQESLKNKKSDYIPLNVTKDTQPEESLQPQAETETETETGAGAGAGAGAGETPLILVQPKIPLKEE